MLKRDPVDGTFPRNVQWMMLLLGKHSYARFQTPLKNYAHTTYKRCANSAPPRKMENFGAASLGRNPACDLLLNVNTYIPRKNYRPRNHRKSDYISAGKKYA